MLPLHPVLKSTIQVLRATRDAIMPFKEEPGCECNELETNEEEKKKAVSGINASELFSLFTANIIKEDVVFTR